MFRWTKFFFTFDQTGFLESLFYLFIYFLNIFNNCSFFYDLKITQYFAKIPNFNISENNPVNTFERCKQMLWEVNKKVEWVVVERIWRISTFKPLKAIFYKDTRQLVCSFDLEWSSHKLLLKFPEGLTVLIYTLCLFLSRNNYRHP
jgi:hypothetical protein